MRYLRFALLGLLALAALLMTTRPDVGFAQTVDPECGYTTAVAGETITLTANMNGGAACAANGVNIHHSGVVLDCNGFSILGGAGGSAGTVVYQSDNVTVQNCVLTGFTYGIYSDFGTGTSSTSILDNVMQDNVESGIHITSGTSDNTIQGNTITGSVRGIFLDSLTTSTVTGNTITGNGAAIELVSTNGNFIYDNYFDSPTNATDDGNNTWNITPTPGTNIIGGSSIGGNFWSDYCGADTNGDGIGDTLLPHKSSGNIQNGGDFYPLTFEGDGDGDGVADSCDICPSEAPDDVDSDDICAGIGFLAPKIGDNDNCPDDINTLQENTDFDLNGLGATVNGVVLPSDGDGDACDDDDDNDSFNGTTTLTQTPGAAATGCPGGSVDIWADCVESYLGTDLDDNCNGAPGSGTDAWPPDVEGSGTISGSDVFAVFPSWLGPTARHDLDASGTVSGNDVFLVFPWWLISCT